MDKFYCGKCDKKFVSNGNLQRHLITERHKRGGKKTRDERKIHICDLCNYRGITPYDLRQHHKTNKHKANYLSQQLENINNKKRLKNALKRAKRSKDTDKITEIVKNLKLLI